MGLPRLSLALIPATVAALALLALATAGLLSRPGYALQTQTRLGIDADSSGNDATSLGSIDECVVIGEGESHTVDIYIQDVTDLLAWSAVLTFEPNVIEISGVDLKQFMAANEGSSVQSASGELPDGDGRYEVGAFDAADPAAPDSGSGVLARVTIKAVGPGLSELSLPLSDLDKNGAPDEGPLLRNVDAEIIGDVNGDTLFDGTIAGARIAVDTSCSDAPGPASDAGGDAGTEEGDDDIGAVTVVVAVVGLVAAVAVGGAVAAWAVRHRRGAGG